MTPARWRQVSRIYYDALARDSRERVSFLREVCRDDEALRQEVESLLAQPASAENFLGEPALTLAAGLVDDPAEPMLTGQRLGAYQILDLLGVGGMGEVYRARDTKLGREVAIKILRRTFATDPDRLARFEREARILAALNHPHIGAIYGVEEAGAYPALILELVEGTTVADRVAGGPLPIDESLAIAGQIADALEAAHEKGIVHRDLKPANVKITPSGVVKVLDFGLAKGVAGDAGDLSHSPTITEAGTHRGVLLGTAAYMSPEQARGLPVDKRTDIWAFGCVLYEMLTGRSAFRGDTVSDVIAAILSREPDLAALPRTTPGTIQTLLQRCLEKSVKDRLHDIADARIEVEDARGARPPRAERANILSRTWIAWMSAAAILTIVTAALIVFALRPRPAPEVRLQINTPGSGNPTAVAIAPDGRKIVFSAIHEGRPRLWLRSLDSVTARPLSQTDDGSAPFWSPDSRSIGFFANGKLKRIDLEGESTLVLASATADVGGSWNRDGTILFSPTPTSPLFRISATGRDVAAVTRLAPPLQTSHRSPHFLPDGRSFVYFVGGGSEAAGLYLGRLDRTESRRLVVSDSGAVYAASGQLLFVRQRRLFAQDFDAKRFELSGDAYSIAEPVDVLTGLAPISASAAGPILYRQGQTAPRRQLMWIDRSGTELGGIGDANSASLEAPALSPDGRRVALNRTLDGNQDVWVADIARGVLSRMTVHAAAETFPVWSPDGSRLVFNSSRSGVFDLYERTATGTGNEELVLATPSPKGPNDWSPDGRFLLYRSPDPRTGFDIWALPMKGDRKPFPVVRTDADERDAQFSADGKWIAYQSNESGRYEIYVQPFLRPGNRLQVSDKGGAQVRWRRDGRELFYIALDDRMMAVAVNLAPLGGQAIDVGRPEALFATRVGGAEQARNRQQYDVSEDGQRFLMNVTSQESVSTITVILNWRPRF